MRLEIEETSALTFDDGSPVRAASAIAPFGDGWLVAQDDATHAAWIRPATPTDHAPNTSPGGEAQSGRKARSDGKAQPGTESITRVRVVDPVDGLETFAAVDGTKHLKPDFEAACAVPGGGVLLLGSGSSPARMRASLVGPDGFRVADLRPLYLAIAAAFGLRADQLNLEGACLAGDRLRWFQRANLAAGAATASADIELSALLAAVRGEITGDKINIDGVRRYDLGVAHGVALAVTDAVSLTDGRILVSAAAEDTPNAVDDGPVVASGLALLGVDGEPQFFAEIPGAEKVEGLAVREMTTDGVRLLAVVDADDHETPSRRLTLHLHW